MSKQCKENQEICSQNHNKKSNAAKLRATRRGVTDFNCVGGLDAQLQALRDIIISPLLHGNVYARFNMKTPRGVLFYGPPGTGKTLVAAALAREINREGLGKVAFIPRQAGDVLDKYIGESERKLREIFENASKNRPAIIFFDEIDGLAPCRCSKDDHAHCSLVTTLLALMDGLDVLPGIVVVGATNRLEAVDPALRRPGRFDRELYFPLPCTEARKDILQVHTQAWSCKPRVQFLAHLAEVTPGFCGADLQALCAEAVLCCMKRLYPDNMDNKTTKKKIKIEADEIQVQDCDFLAALRHVEASTHRMGNKTRKLSPLVKPLLQTQLHVVLNRLYMLWPHFCDKHYRYDAGSDVRYMGRMVLVGSALQGLNNHLLPAILHNLEHLPAIFLNEVGPNKCVVSNLGKVTPSVLLLPRVDEMWTYLDASEQIYLTSLLEDLHAGLPILVIATCEEELPLSNFFYNNTTVLIDVEDPSAEEVEEFFAPLFFAESSNNSLYRVMKDVAANPAGGSKSGQAACKVYSGKVVKKKRSGFVLKNFRPDGHHRRHSCTRCDHDNVDHDYCTDLTKVRSLCTLCGTAEKKKRLALILTESLQRSLHYVVMPIKRKSPSATKTRDYGYSFGESPDPDRKHIFALWKRTSLKTAKDMPLAHMEVLYDTIYACINNHKDNYCILVKNLEETLEDVELQTRS